jgi:Ca2+/Na+ antiporter
MKAYFTSFREWYRSNSQKGKIIFAITAIIMALAFAVITYVYRWEILAIITFFGFVAWIFHGKVEEAQERHAAQARKQQEYADIICSDIVRILREALIGLEHHLGIPNTESKGFIRIFPYTEAGIMRIIVQYARIPNAPKLTRQERFEFARVLNANIANIINDIILTQHFASVFYVEKIKASDGILEIWVIPITDNASYAYVVNHQTTLSQNCAIGNDGGGSAPDEVMYDDEL